MLLEGEVALVHGAGGAIGSAVAKAFAREGARVYASGRTLERVQQVADEIVAHGGSADAAMVDALDEGAVERHTSSVAEREGHIDVCFNAIGFPAVQGTSLADLSHDDFAFPIATWTSSQFLTSRAAGRHIAPRRQASDHAGAMSGRSRRPHRRDKKQGFRRRRYATPGSPGAPGDRQADPRGGPTAIDGDRPRHLTAGDPPPKGGDLS
jgi:NAD(P)-dependent dehydrogenase (short-subunit alcohol dehydrogenase family)